MGKLLGWSVGALLALGAATASAATWEGDEYTVDYNDDTVLNGISGAAGSGSSSLRNLSFNWTVSSDVSLVSTGGLETRQYNLPSFTITAKSGWTLSNLAGFLGNLSYTTFGAGSQASVAVSGDIEIDGVSYGSLAGLLAQSVTMSGPEFSLGYLGGSSDTLPVSFTSFSFTGGSLTLLADAATDGFASIAAQPQNLLQVSFVAAAVPEPQTWGMLLAGMCLMGGVVLRRRRHLQQDR